MIRAVLASPWLPLLYWTAALVAVICGTHRTSLKRHSRNDQIQIVAKSSTPTPGPIHADFYPPTHFWYLFSVLQKPDFSAQKFAMAGGTELALSRKAQIAVSLPITMLSIRVDPAESSVAKTLAIRCRTTVPFSNVHGRTVIIQGVVSEEVVSSTGKILIMAGSRVVGSGRLDLENGRFKSDGRWSIFFDDTELQVQALLLDRPEGLPGILGREPLNEDEARRGRDGRSIVVPRNAPFVLALRGEIQLRDLKSNEASNE
jgi:hypothetical protein